MTDLKTVLVDALNASELSYDNPIYDHHYVGQGSVKVSLSDDGKLITASADDNWFTNHFDADRLATAVRDHFLDREKVREALEDAIFESGEHTEMLSAMQAELWVDRLIEGLAGKAS